MSKDRSQERIKALRRAFELKDSGKSWPDVVQALVDEGYRGTGGRTYTSANLRSEYSRQRDEIMRTQLPAGHDERQALPPERDPRHDENVRAKDIRSADLDVWAERVRTIAREVFTDMMTVHNMYTITGPHERPPEPITIKSQGRGRRENRRYVRITLTLDERLAELFHAEAKGQSLSAGKMMDRVLWERYGKPRLSYGEEPSTDE